MSLEKLVFAVSLVVFLPVAAPAVTPDKLLQNVLNNVEGALKFFSSDYSSINVDGLFGMRHGQGQIQLTIRECEKRPICRQYILPRLTSMEEKLGETCDKAIPYVEQQDEQYFSRFLKTIDAPYLTPYRPVKFGTLRGVEVGTDDQYNEEEGDECLARMMGTHVDNNVKLPVCNITRHCWDFMTKPNTRRYVITHQLLYFIVMEHVGCVEQIEDYVQGEKIENIQTDLCKKIYKESEVLAKTGNVDITSRDLFLEQSMLCGSLGYEDFSRTDWLQMSLRWLNKRSGCFKMDTSNFDKMAEEDLEKALVENHVISPVQNNNRRSNFDMYGDINFSSMRRLLRERMMKDGCLSHTTGLGFATYATYLHYLVRQL